MAKAPTTQKPADSTTTSPEIDDDENATQRTSQTGDDDSADDEKKAQQGFLDEFEIDEDDLGEDALEGTPIKTAAATGTPAATAQSEAVVKPELNADGTPKQAQVPPATSETVPGAEGGTAATPAAPATTETAEQKTARETEERRIAESTGGVVEAQTPEAIQKRYVEWRAQTEDALAKSHYALTQEQMDELDLNPAEAIPKLLSRVYLDAVTATLTQTMNFLPQMIQGVQTQQKTSTENEDKFFGRWPKLKEHHNTVLRIGQVYRQLNPSASMEDFINEVGAQTMVALRIQPEEQQAANGKGNGKSTAQVPPAAFRPSTSTPGGAGPPAQPQNVFAQLAEEFSEDMDDS